MEVYIKNMEMPKGCTDCWLMDGEDSWCCACRGKPLSADYRYGIKERPNWCPLVELPPKWIPVTERLPEENCHVLGYYGFNHGDGHLGTMFIQVLDYYAHDQQPHFEHAGTNGMTVTHWMPLPEPPKEDKP